MVQVYLGFKGEAGDSEPAPAHAGAEETAGQGGELDTNALQSFISNFQAAGGSVA